MDRGPSSALNAGVQVRWLRLVQYVDGLFVLEHHPPAVLVRFQQYRFGDLGVCSAMAAARIGQGPRVNGRGVIRLISKSLLSQ